MALYHEEKYWTHLPGQIKRRWMLDVSEAMRFGVSYDHQKTLTENFMSIFLKKEAF